MLRSRATLLLVVAGSVSGCGVQAATCGDATCGVVGALEESDFCGDGNGGTDCPELAQLSQGCMGSHTEQDCTACGRTFVKVGGDDAADRYFEGQMLVAVRRNDQPVGTCDVSWYGLDLTDCVATGAVRRVDCDGDDGEGG